MQQLLKVLIQIEFTLLPSINIFEIECVSLSAVSRVNELIMMMIYGFTWKRIENIREETILTTEYGAKRKSVIFNDWLIWSANGYYPTDSRFNVAFLFKNQYANKLSKYSHSWTTINKHTCNKRCENTPFIINKIWLLSHTICNSLTQPKWMLNS